MHCSVRSGGKDIEWRKLELAEMAVMGKKDWNEENKWERNLGYNNLERVLKLRFLVQDLLNIFRRQKDAGVYKLRVYH